MSTFGYPKIKIKKNFKKCIDNVFAMDKITNTIAVVNASVS